jgi:glucosamine--fructose-6-phosphate aminotransferase (isomerizing)
MRFVNWAPPVDAQDAVLVISHNAGAETSYAASAYSMSIAAGLRVVTVTRRGGGLIGAFETVEKEASQTYTVSYTAALVALARLAGELGAETCAPEVLARVPGALRAAIDDPGTQAIARPDRLLLFAGEGPAGITAREGALKAREAARSLAEGYDVEYLLHGSAVPITPADHLIALVPPDTHGLVAGVAHAAGAEGVRVTTVSEPADLPPVLAQIPMTARLQMLALRFALERGTDPDIVIEGAWAADDLWSMGAPGG